jgi:hypothetical protein
LSPQVLSYLLAHYDVEGVDVLPWLRDRLPGLEGYEHDLLLSPLFTPDVEDRLRYEEALAEGCLEKGGVEEILGRLAAEKACFELAHDGESLPVPVHPVLVARYVRLLHLDSALPLVEAAAFRPLAVAVRVPLRDRAWQRPQSRALLPALLMAAKGTGLDFTEQVVFLTDFVRSHRPSSLAECTAFLENTAKAYEVDLEKHRSGSRPFYDPELKGSHAGKWKVAEATVAKHERAIALARGLLAAVNALAELPRQRLG